MRFSILVLACTLCACAGTGKRLPAEPMPKEFHDTVHALNYLSKMPFETLRNGLSKSQCGEKSSEMSSLGLMAGLTTRASPSTSLFVDTGDDPDGSSWYALKATNNPGLALCGVRLIAEGQGTVVSVVGLRRKHKEVIAKAVEAGTIFCRCEELSQ